MFNRRKRSVVNTPIQYIDPLTVERERKELSSSKWGLYKMEISPFTNVRSGSHRTSRLLWEITIKSVLFNNGTLRDCMFEMSMSFLMVCNDSNWSYRYGRSLTTKFPTITFKLGKIALLSHGLSTILLRKPNTENVPSYNSHLFRYVIDSERKLRDPKLVLMMSISGAMSTILFIIKFTLSIHSWSLGTSGSWIESK